MLGIFKSGNLSDVEFSRLERRAVQAWQDLKRDSKMFRIYAALGVTMAVFSGAAEMSGAAPGIMVNLKLFSGLVLAGMGCDFGPNAWTRSRYQAAFAARNAQKEAG